MYRWVITAILGVVFLGAAFTANEEVTSTKLNTLNNANIDSSAGIDPEKVDDHSASNSEQDETTDPYVGDAQTLAANARDEIRQLRFQLAQIIQGNSNAAASQKWYNDPLNYLALPASGTQGDVWFYDRGADVKRLAAGTDGQFLRSQGANSDLAWSTGIVSPASTTQGDILYRDASASTWVRLAAGTTGNSLVTQGANYNPKWASASGAFDTQVVAKRTTVQSIPHGTWTKVTIDTETRDNNNDFDSTTNYRFTAPVAGGYFIDTDFEWVQNGAGNNRRILLYLNGTAISPSVGHGDEENGSAVIWFQNASQLLHLAANDYVELYCFQNAGSSLSSISAWFSVGRLW